jgi:outer membrane protein TolC
MKAARLRSEMLAADAARARRDLLAPRVSAFGSLDRDDDRFGDGGEDSYLVGAVLEWELFAGGRRRAASDRAFNEWGAARAEADALRNRLRLDRAQAAVQVAEAAQRLQVAESGLASAREALRITRERYARQAADSTELLTAQTGLTAMEVGVVAARYDCLTAASNWHRARGRLVETWERREEQP